MKRTLIAFSVVLATICSCEERGEEVEQIVVGAIDCPNKITRIDCPQVKGSSYTLSYDSYGRLTHISSDESRESYRYYNDIITMGYSSASAIYNQNLIADIQTGRVIKWYDEYNEAHECTYNEDGYLTSNGLADYTWTGANLDGFEYKDGSAKRTFTYYDEANPFVEFAFDPVYFAAWMSGMPFYGKRAANLIKEVRHEVDLTKERGLWELAGTKYSKTSLVVITLTYKKDDNGKLTQINAHREITTESTTSGEKLVACVESDYLYKPIWN